jgi:hypothetical protein
MSLAAIVTGGLVVAWFIVTVLAHIPPFQFWINRVDGCNLIPHWNFFAPNPGDKDYFLVARARCHDGRITEWQNVPLYGSRPKYAWLWHPQKRAAKIFNDTVQSIRFLRRVEGVPDSGLPFSLPYLLLLKTASRVVPAAQDAAEIQFAIIESIGHDERALSCAFLSSFHRR